VSGIARPGERRIVGGAVPPLRRRRQAEDETKGAFGERGAVAGGGEGFAGLGELHFEAEQVGFEHLPGVEAGAGGGDRRPRRLSPGLDGATASRALRMLR
jgi:hypothetical protein